MKFACSSLVLLLLSCSFLQAQEPESPTPRIWLSADYLLWRINNPSLPPLLATGPLTDPRPGILGQPGTRTLIGGDISQDATSGLRLGLGGWFSQEEIFGIEASGFFLGKQSRSLGAASDGSAVLSRPFVNLTGVPGGFDVAFPGNLAGAFQGSISNELYGWDVNLLANLGREENRSFDLLLGFRALSFEERLQVGENVQALAPNILFFQRTAVPDTSRLLISDQFALRNRFYGPQIGGKFDWSFHRLHVNLLTKIALGVTHQNAQIAGNTTVVAADGSLQSTSGGVLAVASNSGDFDRNVFTVVPEIGIQFAYNVTCRLTLQVGYSFLYWSNVARAGDQIDRTINPALVPSDPIFGTGGAARPGFSFDDSGLFVHGVTFGGVFKF